MNRFFAFISLACLPLALLSQSPWSRSRAGFYVQAGFHFIPQYGSLFGSGDGDLVLDRLVSEKQWQLYGEYGLTNKTTLVASLPWVINERGDENPDSPYQFAKEYTGKLSGLGNASFAIRHQFLRGPIALAGSLRVGFPAGATYRPSTDLRTGYDALTIQPMLSAGKGWGKFYGYLYGGYAYRTNDYSDNLQAGAEIGCKIASFWLMGFSEAVISTKNGDRQHPGLDALTGLYGNDQEWLSIGLKAIWQPGRFWGLGVSAAGAAWAHQVPKSPGLSAFVFFKWD